MKWLAYAVCLGALLGVPAALAQFPATPSPPTGLQVVGAVQYRATVKFSATITAGGTFQTLQAATARQSLTVQNNNASGTDYCYLWIGAGSATEGGSIALGVGQAYTRYWPYVPQEALQVTCANTSDSIYADYQ